MCLEDYAIASLLVPVRRQATLASAGTPQVFAAANRNRLAIGLFHASATVTVLFPAQSGPVTTAGLTLTTSVSAFNYFWLDRHGDMVRRDWSFDAGSGNPVLTWTELIAPEWLTDAMRRKIEELRRP